MAPSFSPLQVNTLADLRQLPLSADTVVLVVGANTMSDGLGGFYRWSATSTADEEMKFFNVIRSTLSDTGRWVRVFQRVTIVPQGILTTIGGVKTLYALGSTNSAGEITVNTTLDNTATGAAIFSEIWQTAGDSTATGGTANDAVIASRVSIATDLKQVVYRFVRGNPTTLGGTVQALLNVVIMPLRAVPAGTSVTVIITGV